MLRPNSRRYCYQDTSHPSPKTVFSLTSLYWGQSVKSKNDERGGGGKFDGDNYHCVQDERSAAWVQRGILWWAIQVLPWSFDHYLG